MTMPTGITTRARNGPWPGRETALRRRHDEATENAPAVTALVPAELGEDRRNSSENAVRVLTPMPMVTNATATTTQP
jgi:hypothetical protein